MAFDPLEVSNEADPLTTVQRSDYGRELFDKIVGVANGFNYDSVVDAAANLLVNAIRQSSPNAKIAEATFDQVIARTKALLIEQHYDPITGKRKSVFAHHQVIDAPYFESKNKIRGQ